MRSTTYRYDGSFAGVLCAIVRAHEFMRDHPDAPTPRITGSERPEGFFETVREVVTDGELAERAEQALERRGGPGTARLLYAAFLSEEAEIEQDLLVYVGMISKHGRRAGDALLEPSVRRVRAAAARVGREVHRMHAFVRFEETADGVFEAVIEPDCNVIPLLDDHFVARYPAQPWVIYDRRRGYGLRYRDRVLDVVTDAPEGEVKGEEKLFQQLWRSYYASVDIPERRNWRLHKRHLPRRYWRHLTEKQEDTVR